MDRQPWPSPVTAAAPGDEGGPAEKVFVNPLASHPVALEPPAAMLGGGRGDPEALAPLASPVSSIGAPSSSGRGGGSSAGGGGARGGGDRHLRRLTQNLVEVLESMSGSVQPAAAAGCSSSKGGAGRGYGLGALALPRNKKTTCTPTRLSNTQSYRGGARPRPAPWACATTRSLIWRRGAAPF